MKTVKIHGRSGSSVTFLGGMLDLKEHQSQPKPRQEIWEKIILLDVFV